MEDQLNITWFTFGPPRNFDEMSKEAKELWGLMCTGQIRPVIPKTYENRTEVYHFKGKKFTWSNGQMKEEPITAADQVA